MFKRRGVWTCYLPQPLGARPVQRSLGTKNRAVALRMERMVHDLGDARRWDVLALLTDGRLPIGDTYDAYVRHQLDALVGREASPRVGPMVEGWIASLDVRDTTRAMYKRQVLALFGEDERVSGITPGSARDALAKVDVSGGTKRTYFVALSSFCHYLVAHGVLPVHPLAEKGTVPRPKRNGPRTRWETADNDRRLCLAAPSPLREFFALVHSTGAERNAARAMTRSDIDLSRWEVHIPGTKTATRDRRGIPVDAWARPLLEPYVRAVLAGPLFPGLSLWVISVGHRAAREAVGLHGYQLRDARHSVAIRWLVLDGVPMWDVAERLGHGDMTEATKTYTKTVLREAAKRLGVAGATTHTTTKEA